jgi:hypothetical protein
MNWKCFFGFHKWKQMGGLTKVGNGEFKKTFTCSKCYKTKYEIK